MIKELVGISDWFETAPKDLTATANGNIEGQEENPNPKSKSNPSGDSKRSEMS